MFGCCSPDSATAWAAPHEYDFNENLLTDGNTDTDTATESSAFDYKAMDNNVDAELCPSWMDDKESDCCLQCDKKFSASVRRSHCRRCRNLFCKKCVSHTSPILYYNITESAKVCDSCFGELADENTYIKLHRPILIRGESFKKGTMMGLGSRVVELRLLHDMGTLVYDDKTSVSKPSKIVLSKIKKIKMPGLTTFELKDSDKSYEFEADTANTQKKWIDAIKMAVERAREPSLKERVHRDRRERIENRYKQEDAMNRQRMAEQTKLNRQSKRSEIRDKYNRR